MEKKAYTIRLFLDIELKIDDECLITNYQVHYIKNVMRASLGDNLFIFNGKLFSSFPDIISFEAFTIAFEILFGITLFFE